MFNIYVQVISIIENFASIVNNSNFSKQDISKKDAYI